jgi:sensor histidine kinase YesM
LLQPFLENAIWHGLVNKQFGGFLHVRFSIEGNFLKCVVEDNGVGRKRAMELKSVDGNSHKSLALEITRDRIKLLNQGKNANISLQIEDLFSPENISLGTRVTLLVPLKIVHDL